MIRTSLQTYASTNECVDAINSLASRFIKEHQRKSVVDLLVSTTYPALDGNVVTKGNAAVASVHEITLMVTDKVQKETEAARLDAEIKWFKAQVGESTSE